MPRTCTVCAHQDHEAIDRVLVAGDPFRFVSERFDVSLAALHRHKTDHLPAVLSSATTAQDAVHGDDLLAQLKGLATDAHRIKDKAEEAGDFRTALAGIRELVRIVEVLAELRSELDRRPVVNLWVSPEWQTVRTVLLTALLGYPEARAAVAEQLMQLEAGA